MLWSDYRYMQAGLGLHCLLIFEDIFFKGSIFLKNRHFIIQERVNKLINDINTIIKCGI